MHCVPQLNVWSVSSGYVGKRLCFCSTEYVHTCLNLVLMDGIMDNGAYSQKH